MIRDIVFVRPAGIVYYCKEGSASVDIGSEHQIEIWNPAATTRCKCRLCRYGITFPEPLQGGRRQVLHRPVGQRPTTLIW